MKGGDIYKSLNRTNLFPSIYNWVLGKKLGKLGQEEKTDTTPYVPTISTSDSTNTPTTPNINELYTPPMQGRESDRMVDSPPVIQPSEETEQIGAGGNDGNVQDNKVFVPNIRIPQEQQTKTPRTQQNYSNVKNITDAGDVDVLNSDYNKKLRQDVLDYIAYASKFGEYGQPFINQATNTTLPLLQQVAPEVPKFSKDQYFTDKDGKTWFAPSGNNEPLVPVLTQNGQQLTTKLPEFDKSRVNVTVDPETGNAVIYNLQSGVKEDTGIPIEDFDYKFGLDQDQFNFDQEYKNALLLIKQNKVGRGSNNGSNSGDGTFSSSNKTGLILTDRNTGKPLELGWQIDPETQQQVQVVKMPNNTWMKWSEIEGVVNKLNSKKDSEEANWQLNSFGIEALTSKNPKHKQVAIKQERKKIFKTLFGVNPSWEELSDENIQAKLKQNWDKMTPEQQKQAKEYFKSEGK